MQIIAPHSIDSERTFARIILFWDRLSDRFLTGIVHSVIILIYLLI